MEGELREMQELKKGTMVYYAQIFKPPVGEYNVVDLKVHTVNEEKHYFTGCETKGNKHTLLFDLKALGNNVFFNRADALAKVKAAEEQYKNIKVSDERDGDEE